MNEPRDRSGANTLTGPGQSEPIHGARRPGLPSPARVASARPGPRPPWRPLGAPRWRRAGAARGGGSAAASGLHFTRRSGRRPRRCRGWRGLVRSGPGGCVPGAALFLLPSLPRACGTRLRSPVAAVPGAPARRWAPPAPPGSSAPAAEPAPSPSPREQRRARLERRRVPGEEESGAGPGPRAAWTRAEWSTR